MKKIIMLSAVMAVLSLSASAQSVTLYNNKTVTKTETMAELQKRLAKNDKAVEKKADKAATWIERGGIYYRMGVNNVYALYDKMPEEEAVKAVGQPEEAELVDINRVEYKKYNYPDKDLYFSSDGKLAMYIVKKYPVDGAIDTAFDCYVKANSLSPTPEEKNEINQYINYIVQAIRIDAANNLKLGNAERASKGFYKAYTYAAQPPMNYVDTTILFYAGVTALETENYADAENYLNQCLEMGYEDGGNIYNYLAICMSKLGQTDQMDELLSKGVERYPSNKELLEALIAVYNQQMKSPEEVLPLIRKAQAGDPNNYELYVQEGIVYSKMEKYPEAEASYNKALSLDPKNFVALYNLGFMYYEKGNSLARQVMGLDLNDAKGRQALKDESDEARKTSFDYMERAYQVDPTSFDVVQVLKEISFMFYGSEDAAVSSKYEPLYKKYQAEYDAMSE